MSFAVRQAWHADLERLVELAVGCQGDPNRSCHYLSSDIAALRTELREIEGVDSWTTATWVALDDARDVIGWIAAESDRQMGRVWWFGPFVADADLPLADAIADGLFGAGRRSLAQFPEHELAIDARSSWLQRFAERNGFEAEEGSVVLRLSDLHIEVPGSSVRIEAAAESIDAEVVALHDAIFPGTHSTGAQLFGLTGGRHDRFVARHEGDVVGYVATEVQHDGSLYIDYVGVSDASRGQGIGRALVGTAIRARADEATHAHLTVRVSNAAARELYASLGFVEELVLVPHRLGFTLE
ncbi:MAG: GNAT family N-acetyltransferase [Ilumatobacter sp.]|jgi:ribosomal protein S18 acetylase RimI-like enzyme|uniref:GNAT family N-acetyltransferase n=1 Tax=Ilumatobacter sp. TaxID=1967498 RepID=UPI001D7DBAB4|nr:GNAT family N-acetyltransferase [Ilumatobacter sp.]MBT5277728.1 GNAT family N-acetyltransferase [Ilumatobacter sp.]MBT5555109.1 GNAT family N-acetyltransferase [Ilumatobacter sp.]MBT5866128.1 GNAT family N-acetyltransferase [Ilumatobacter sp.]MDG0975197.1 GNAT family N-acetyltransferase [Ilumatobacter sp.]